MKKVLVINSSSKIKRGFSRDIGDYFVSYLSTKIKLEQIVYRVLRNQEIPHITQE